jgi:hypothetical protein
MNREEATSTLTLMLMYLTSWRERPEHALRCWKGYDFDVLDRLEEQGLISNSHRAKSAYLSEDGETRALELLKRFGFAVEVSG